MFFISFSLSLSLSFFHHFVLFLFCCLYFIYKKYAFLFSNDQNSVALITNFRQRHFRSSFFFFFCSVLMRQNHTKHFQIKSFFLITSFFCWCEIHFTWTRIENVFCCRIKCDRCWQSLVHFCKDLIWLWHLILFCWWITSRFHFVR